MTLRFRAQLSCRGTIALVFIKVRGERLHFHCYRCLSDWRTLLKWFQGLIVFRLVRVVNEFLTDVIATGSRFFGVKVLRFQMGIARTVLSLLLLVNFPRLQT